MGEIVRFFYYFWDSCIFENNQMNSGKFIKYKKNMINLFILGVIGLPQLFFFLLLIFVVKYIFFNKKKSQQFESSTNFDNVINTSKSVIENNITKVKKIAEQNISKSYITNYNWLLINDSDENIIYTFRNNNELLITKNGIVEKGTYELIVDNNSILITRNDIIEHYNIINQKNDFLTIQLLSTDKILIFANQTKYKDYLKSQLKELANKG